MKKFLSTLLVLLLTPCVTVRADEGPKPTAYFDPATLDPREYLPNPPADDSATTEKELEVILQAQADRTPQQLELINSEVHYSVFVFDNVVGDWLSKDTIDGLPLTTALLARVMETAKPIAESAKNDWNRPRPFLVNSRVYPPIERPKDSSYPSNHAIRATVDALVLSELAPDEAQAIQARGRQVGDDRIDAGVNFPSDVAAGRKLGQAIFDRLMDDKGFADDLKAAKLEVAAARKKRI